MKLWKHTLITAFAFFGITSTVLYTSCEKDSCLDLKCRNGGACAEGFCRCPVGYEGTECETEVATKFLGRFIGHYSCPNNSPLVDTVDIWLEQSPNKVFLVEHSNVTDTMAGTVTGNVLDFEVQNQNDYRKYTRAQLDARKLTVFIEEVLNTTTGQKRTCSFIGFK